MRAGKKDVITIKLVCDKPYSTLRQIKKCLSLSGKTNGTEANVLLNGYTALSLAHSNADIDLSIEGLFVDFILFFPDD